MRSGATVPVVWSGSLFDRTGYADEARGFVLALDRAGIDIRADPLVWSGWGTSLPAGAAERIEHLLAVVPPERFVHVLHFLPHVFYRDARAALSIGRTMFETDGLPADWVARCNELDEVWVPSDFNRETFAAAGVAAEKLHTIPGGIEASLYEPVASPLELALPDGFVFLSVLGWEARKGWDALVRAYVQEFAADEGVVLALKVTPPAGRGVAACREELEALVRAELGREPAAAAPIVLLELALAPADLPRLYGSADAFVLASRGEGWGRPYLEAMAAGLPTIGTRWGGQLAFMTDANSYLVDCALIDVPEVAWRDVPAFRGQRWAEPSVEHLRAQMRRVFENRAGAGAVAERAREEVLTRWTWEQAAGAVAERLTAREGLVRRRRPRRRVRPRVTWEGPFHVEHSLSRVSQALCRALVGSQRIDLRIAADELPPPHGQNAQIRVRHSWPPRFDRPEEDRLVLVQPWELGSLPAAWLEPIAEVVDEVWVPTSFVRESYVRSGVEAAKVAVVPNGVDPLQFNPAIPPLDLLTAKGFRFLFVGGTIARKGADILVDTYLRTFGPEDDVCKAGSASTSGSAISGRCSSRTRRTSHPSRDHRRLRLRRRGEGAVRRLGGAKPVHENRAAAQLRVGARTSGSRPAQDVSPLPSPDSPGSRGADALGHRPFRRPRLHS